MTIKPLQAFNGDSILLSFPSEQKITNILIDGGVGRTYQRSLKPLLNKLSELGQAIDLLVITHIDDDHIGGIKELYQDAEFDRSIIKKVWFNSGTLLSPYFNKPLIPEREVEIIKSDTTDMSVAQGVTLEKELAKNDSWIQALIKIGTVENLNGIKITILSPGEKQLKRLNKRWETETNNQKNMSGEEHEDFEFTIDELNGRKFKEDKRVANGSSISFLIEADDKFYLFLADSHPSVIEKALRSLGYSAKNKLSASFVKISHHSSKFNTSPGLLAIIESQHFFVSTDGSRHGLPNKEPMARIIVKNPGVTLHFNYEEITKEIFLDVDRTNHKFTIKYDLGTNYLFED